MSKDTVIAIGGGGLSAAISLAFMAGSQAALLLVYVAPLPLLMVGLALGAKAGAVAGISGFLFAGLLGGAPAAGLYGVVFGVPVLLIVFQGLLQRPTPSGSGVLWYPEGSILCWLAALGAAYFLMAVLASHMGGGKGLQPMVSAYLEQVFTIMLPSLAETQRRTVIGALSPLFPGLVVMVWIVVVAVNGLVAQGLLARLGRNLRPTSAFTGLTLPEWMSTILVIGAALALFGPGEVEYIGRNLALILAVPFFFLGLAVIHTLVRRAPTPGVLLVAFYMVLLFSGWAALVVAGIGLIEQWLGLRWRFAGPNPGGESE
jgi:hypothetical protein